MKLQTGDLLLTQMGKTILIVDVDKSGLIKGFHDNKTRIENIGYERNVVTLLDSGRWRHFGVLK